MMRVSRSRLGITSLIIIVLSTILLTNCGIYNRIKSRQDLVDGAKAYKDKKVSFSRITYFVMPSAVIRMAKRPKEKPRRFFWHELYIQSIYPNVKINRLP